MKRCTIRVFLNVEKISISVLWLLSATLLQFVFYLLLFCNWNNYLKDIVKVWQNLEGEILIASWRSVLTSFCCLLFVMVFLFKVYCPYFYKDTSSCVIISNRCQLAVICEISSILLNWMVFFASKPFMFTEFLLLSKLLYLLCSVLLIINQWNKKFGP